MFARYITESGPASSRCLGGSVRQELTGRLRSFKAATGGATSGKRPSKRKHFTMQPFENVSRSIDSLSTPFCITEDTKFPCRRRSTLPPRVRTFILVTDLFPKLGPRTPKRPCVYDEAVCSGIAEIVPSNHHGERDSASVKH